ncbi:hypothetical protein DRQ53_08190 [bacterium]|nr:MAG: hypothetical protein DRQ53_08190 [bacterium]
MLNTRMGRLLTVVLLLPLLLAGTSASAFTVLSFVSATTELSCDEARPIDVWVDIEAADLRGVSLVLEFDPLLINPIAVEVGQLFTDAPCGSFLRWNNAAAVGDSIYVDVAGLGCSVQGPGAIVRIWVTGIADGSTLIKVRSVILRDSVNQPIAAVWTPGHIIVACAVPVTDRSWATLKSAYR